MIAYPDLGQLDKPGPTSNLLYPCGSSNTAGIGPTKKIVLIVLRLTCTPQLWLGRLVRRSLL